MGYFLTCIMLAEEQNFTLYIKLDFEIIKNGNLSQGRLEINKYLHANMEIK